MAGEQASYSSLILAGPEFPSSICSLLPAQGTFPAVVQSGGWLPTIPPTGTQELWGSWGVGWRRRWALTEAVPRALAPP